MGRLAVAVIVSLWVLTEALTMITTPPGLCCLSLAYLACWFPGMYLVQKVSLFHEVCSAAMLRTMNVVLAVLWSIILYEIITYLRPTLDKGKATFLAVILALYPFLCGNFLYVLYGLAAFVAFVHWNGSVVLGAKEAHACSPHFAQIMYFSVVSTLATAPLHFFLSHVANVFHSFWKNRPLVFFSTAGGSYCWLPLSAFFQYLLVPFYIHAWFSIFNILDTIPFYFLMLNSHMRSNQSWIVIGLMRVVINIFIMMMLLFRPFHWNHEPAVQRFIW
ncbi:hypothetical protein P3X46_020299 [Hevea brasiliensis]|uniref:Dol-P-Glc:Glc(2)Man(9)GlcNAc(2)-PP-Dol alpha-1,2-glucosyltransferase n=1 Tax=Hevea brasiliensis TaxID=3981 RepID=A0ABQ9LNJ7_HEVBR|nr:hypothetical protein P3X46_020299 [Hevea brasiliensis]